MTLRPVRDKHLPKPDVKTGTEIRGELLDEQIAIERAAAAAMVEIIEYEPLTEFETRLTVKTNRPVCQGDFERALPWLFRAEGNGDG